MKIVKYNRYGSYNRVYLDDIEKPVVTDDQVLVKIFAASINKLDIHVLEGTPIFFRLMIGIFRPKVKSLGSDISGVVEAVGKNVTDFKAGDEVFGQLMINQEGGFAEYALVPPIQLTLKPSNITHSEAAAIPIAGLTALQVLRQTEVKENSKILIHGASGGVGTFLIQIAKSMKAHVTAVCSTRNIELAKESKADVVIDYKNEKWYDSPNKYDVIIGVNGYNSLKRYRDALVDNGVYLSVGGDNKVLFQMYVHKLFMNKKGRRFLGFVAKISKSDREILSRLLENKQVHPYIDKEFPLEQAKEALEHFMKGKTIGKTIIKIN